MFAEIAFTEGQDGGSELVKVYFLCLLITQFFLYLFGCLEGREQKTIPGMFSLPQTSRVQENKKLKMSENRQQATVTKEKEGGGVN